MLLILAWIGSTIADIPKSLLVPNRSYPPIRPVNVHMKIDVHQTYMSWIDTRKSWVPSEGENTFDLDAALTPSDFRRVYSRLWIPSIKNRFKLLTFRSTSNLFSERLFFTSYGGVSHMFKFMLMVSCLITDINYPYDVYVCYEKFGDYEVNNTVQYTYVPTSDLQNTRKFMTVSETAYRSGHKITNYTSYKYVQNLEEIDKNLKGLYPESIDIGFTVQRYQPRVVVNLILPIYCITLMDAFVYIFGYGMQRAYLLPVYATFFTDISSIYTIRRLPHITRWFFARLFSTSACLIAMIFTQALTRCSRRFIAILATTSIFYGIFSIPYDIFR
ncbi:hypothetical protein NECAME_01570 [Necator americanus]|uniref:Neurotransmitter-gated ion-channel ligand-binding domain-containing protein n=1 Tax=Necator americanus TaxID=51031 RepID=W2TT89_NECAM|nr:hypothetical protein NECAME_01570 [Necator americanus]ETN85008.1 hypothetical protein NECAME_01570 [Necator americanus]